MKALKIIAKRFAAGLVTAWGVLTVVFLAFTATNDWVATRISGRVIFGQTSGGGNVEAAREDAQAAVDEYLASRNLDRPLPDIYVDWMGNMLTLDWGRSFETSEAVFPMITSATARTAAYVVPAVVLAVAIGTVVGMYAALNPDSRLSDLSRAGSYLFFALPSFWLGGLLLGAANAGAIDKSPLLFEHILPVVLVTMTLLGGYVSYSRAYALEHVSADFVTLVRAKGAGPVTVARHVARNAAIPLFSMLFTEVLGLLVLSIFVIEVVFGIEGFGLVFFEAIDARDLPVLLGGTVVLIFVGVFGNVIQDLSYQYLDPRVDAE
jgi:peptide/nickel transport system permease protein